MKRHLNTLYVTTQGTYLSKDGETVLVRVGDEVKLRVPIHNLGGVVCFGNVLCSPFALGLCAEKGVNVAFLSEHGRFLARVVGETSGNVLLRREQYRRADAETAALAIARHVVIGKIANARTVLMRALREYPQACGRERVAAAEAALDRYLNDSRRVSSLDELRGIEGIAGKAYFAAFGDLVVQQRDHFPFSGRTRRPPLDRLNSLLSFIYTLLVNDLIAALESVGLDPQVGFLHRDRPGRPSLALDLLEELRPFIADRLVLSLVNRRQVQHDDFEVKENGAVLLDAAGRRKVIAAYQQRKDDVLTHPYLGEKTTVGLLPHLQSLLLARHLRGDLDGYPPLIVK